MAKLSKNKKYVIVEKGDSLSQIAQDYAGGESNYKKLAAINDIANPDLIYVGQKIYLSSQAPTTPSNTTPDSLQAVINHFGLQSDSTKNAFATWKWSKSNTKEYKIQWQKQVMSFFWPYIEDTTTTYKYSVCTIPDDAKQIRFRVKPICSIEKKTDSGYWEADWTSWRTFSEIAPETPPTPSIELDGLKLTTSVANVDDSIEIIEFNIVKDDVTSVKSEKIAVSTNSASFTCTVEAGGKYKARTRAYVNDVPSAWSDYSANVETIPATPAKLTRCAATSTTSIGLEWAAITTATTYDIEYTTDRNAFDMSDNTTTKTGVESTKWELTNIEEGAEYFFRIRAVNSKGVSGWSEISSTVLGKGPSAPTTWSSTNTAIAGESLNLYWVHNPKDGSSQTRAMLELTFANADVDLESITVTPHLKGASIENTKIDSDKKTITYTIKNTEDKDDVDKTSSCAINTSMFTEGALIRWRVCTMGVVESYGEWSVQRAVDIYTQPTVTLSVTKPDGSTIDVENSCFIVEYDSTSDTYVATTDPVHISSGERFGTITTTTGQPVYSGVDESDEEVYYYIVEGISVIRSLPLKIQAIPAPKTQAPTGYHISIIANKHYDTVDNLGNEKTVTEGEEVYSKNFDINKDLEATISAGDISLQDGISYTLKCVASMNSGLTTEESKWNFLVNWDRELYTPTAEIRIDLDNLSAYIKPSCVKYSIVYYKVTKNLTIYTKTSETVDSVFGEEVDYAFTTTGEQVYQGVSGTGEEIYYCMVEHEDKIEDVLLAVYRREFDGSFTEIGSGIKGSANTTIVDPHPALDYARYRIVATSITSGAVTYNNMPSKAVGEKAVVIQWAEQWSSFDIWGDEDSMETPPWTGSLLKLPYNIDVSTKGQTDVSLVKYIGRKHPVTYYGTQLGETITLNVEIEADDKETLYALRRLKVYTGDVYVREPSGTGYWANVIVSFDEKHCAKTIPVTIEVTRVEGGV